MIAMNTDGLVPVPEAEFALKRRHRNAASLPDILIQSHKNVANRKGMRRPRPGPS
jgi:hypothetical protein